MLRDLEPLATSWGAYAFAVFLGLLWGSFANVCIYRWPPTPEFPRGRSVVLPGSHCFACKTPIRWYDNTPLLSWLWLRGKCRTCKAPFSGRYLIVEGLTGLLFGLAWWFTISVGTYFEPFDHRLIRFAIYAAFCFVMVVIAFIDIDHKLILDKLTLPSIAIFYALSFLLPEHHWYDGLIGAVVGYGLPWTIGEVYWLLSNRDGLGLGDSKLLAVIGALLGIRGVVASLFGGALLGAVIGIIVLLRGQQASGPASRRSAVFAVIAVASVAVASYGALTNRVVIGAVGSVLALAVLVIGRRLEPDAEDDAAARVEEPELPEPEDRSGTELAARVLALVAGILVLFAVTFQLLGAWPIALGAGLLGIGLLLLAKRLVPVSAEPEAEVTQSAPEAEPAPVETSLMRTELPFGPFLALAALFYLFAEPWILLNFHLPGG
ncbi:MAG: prepilin peptidase [Myxococcales bacterium]|nr:prepilin peptidase [Myxococcales bacterium]